jgi:hypothetical protein
VELKLAKPSETGRKKNKHEPSKMLNYDEIRERWGDYYHRFRITGYHFKKFEKIEETDYQESI